MLRLRREYASLVAASLMITRDEVE